MLSPKNGIYGIKSLMLYDLTTFLPIAMAEVIGELSLNVSPEFAEMLGGNNPFAWESAMTTLSPEGSLTIREFIGPIAKIATAGERTVRAAETGSVSQFVNKKGTSFTDAATGVVVTVLGASAANLKDGRYIMVATGASTFDVYCTTNLGFGLGVKAEFLDDSLKVFSIDLTSSPVDKADWGLSFAKGTGTLALVTGDAAMFTVRSANSGSETIRVGSTSSQMKSVGLIAYTPVNPADGNYYEIEVFNCTIAGFPATFTEKAFWEGQHSLRINYDSKEDAVYAFTRVKKAA